MSAVVVSGMRPTGDCHLGHYAGAISNWVELQKNHECYFFLADGHALTSHYQRSEIIEQSRYDYVRAWIASGIDPEKSVVYCQSDILEVFALFQVLLCLTPPGWADRSPSWKDFQASEGEKTLDNLGFYTYPILQTADVALMKGSHVPVGADQVPHIEISRDIVRKFNRLYGDVLPEPEALLTKVPKLLGPHGQKMSSSLGNTISFRETEKSLKKKLNKLMTDDQRQGVEFPGNPENCSVFEYHKFFSSMDNIDSIEKGCRSAQLSCGECKQKLLSSLIEKFIPLVEKYQKITDKECREILAEGNKKAQAKAQQTWAQVKAALKF